MTTLYKWIYELSYRFTQPNWDRDTIPPEVAALAKSGKPGGHALDLGCGTGAHSIYFAQQGYSVVGVDFSSKAIEMARKKATQAGVAVELRLGDVTRLDFLHDSFDIALDVGCFHGLNEVERARYAKNLARLTRPGSLFLLWAVEGQSHMGIGIDSDVAERSFSPDFLLDHVERGNLHGRISAWYWFRRR